ncbi:MAG: glycogen debranching protein [Candidatus Nanopelagicales bacterium]
MQSKSLGFLATVEAWEAEEGAPAPLGATWVDEIDSWNFAVHSRYATAVTLLLYGPDNLTQPVLERHLQALVNKTGRIWHVMVSAADAQGATYYAWRVDGPDEPRHGHRFDSSKVLSDPVAHRLLFAPDYSRDLAAERGQPNDGRAILGVLPRPTEPFDWGQVAPPRHSSDTVIYEAHVKGFTERDESVSPDNRGTFAGIIEKIPYLQKLGVTVLELLPVHQFDPQEGSYWGYMTLNFFAPHHLYAATDDPVTEFREMVKALHEAGLELWLDVVYNHTTEGDQNGPTLSFRGLDNSSYYLINPDGYYINDSGCGNTTDASEPPLRHVVLRSLRFWAQEMGVDGFRFDLASILTRDETGAVAKLPPLITEISNLAGELDFKVIAEAWDMAAYQLGQGFPGIMWRQWNGRFRDDVRSFVKGDAGKIHALMDRVYGSADLFPDGPGDMYRPYQSVNFVTAHDGFCLYDLVSYNDKHNEANGHGGTDGTSDNYSWNCGHEGEQGAPAEVLRLRGRQLRNFAALLMLSNGVPMMVAGDEFANTQQGNNNPYNQDNEITWLGWARLPENQELFDFWAGMIAFRKAHRAIGRSRFWREDVTWVGAAQPEIDPGGKAVAWILSGQAFDEPDLYVMVNSGYEPAPFTLHRGQPADWRLILDTATGNPPETDTAPTLQAPVVTLSPYSLVVLEAARG